MDIITRINELRRRSAALETSPGDRETHLAQAASHAERFLSELPVRPIYTAPGPRDEALRAMELTESPSVLGDALSLIDEHVERTGYNLGASGFFGYIPSGGLYESALADYLAAVSNRYAGVGFSAPGATRMEDALLRWLAGIVGYPPMAEGDLTSGGSMAATSAVIVAREACGVCSSDVAKRVVYLTAQTHHTFRKALFVAGLGDCIVQQVPLDDRYRMRADSLEEQIQSDRESDLQPWLVAASAGTTDTGAIDPLSAIADVAERHRVWFHVDAAYGGAFALSDSGRERLQGIERSDSLILDPHKGFFLPCGTGVVLVRDGRQLGAAFRARGIYMQDVSGDPERAPCDFSPELTRPFRALRFWLPFKIHGVAAFRAALEEKILLARYFHERVSRIPGIEAGPEPDLSVVIFRYLSDAGNPDEVNRRLLQRIVSDGRIFVSSSTIDGHYMIRFAVLGFNSHLEDVDTALDIIRESIEELR